MAFIPNPGIGRNKFQQPAMTPLTELQPQFVTPNTGQRAKVIQSNANANSRTNTKPSGRRAGGKGKRNTKTNVPNNKYLPIPTRMNDRDGSKSSLNITSSDFGYDIQGATQATPYQGKRDTTLFRDYNQPSKINYDEEVISTNAISNSIKLLDINLKASLQWGYQEAWTVILNMMTRDVISNTRAAAGAMNILSDITKYFNTVIPAYDLLIELEVIQAWSPASNDYYDRSLRALAVAASPPDILEYRAQLRQALIPHVLPHDWMMYIKWLRETKLQNTTPESTKLRFNSRYGVALINGLFKGTSIDDWTGRVNSVITDLNALNPAIPATLINNVNCVQLKNVKDYYTGVHNSATYDPDFNDIFNNRVITWENNGIVYQYPNLELSHPCYAAFHSDTPYSMALASLDKQRGFGGVPLEGELSRVKVDTQAVFHNSFQISESTSGITTHTIRGIEHWDESCDDSTHVIDLQGNGTLDRGVSTPKGINTTAFVVDFSNIHMAARESLSALTLTDY